MLFPQATPYVKGGNSKTLLRFLSLNTVFDLNFFQAEGIQCSGMLAPLFSGDVTLSSPQTHQLQMTKVTHLTLQNWEDEVSACERFRAHGSFLLFPLMLAGHFKCEPF